MKFLGKFLRRRPMRTVWTKDELGPEWDGHDIGFWNAINGLHYKLNLSDAEESPITGWDMDDPAIEDLYRKGSYRYVRERFGLVAHIPIITNVGTINVNGNTVGVNFNLKMNQARVIDAIIYLFNADTNTMIQSTHITPKDGSQAYTFTNLKEGAYYAKIHFMILFDGHIMDIDAKTDIVYIYTDLSKLPTRLRITNDGVIGDLVLGKPVGYQIIAVKSYIQNTDIDYNYSTHDIIASHEWKGIMTGHYVMHTNITAKDLKNGVITNVQLVSNGVLFTVAPTIDKLIVHTDNDQVQVETDYNIPAGLKPTLTKVRLIDSGGVVVRELELDRYVYFDKVYYGNYHVKSIIEYVDNDGVTHTVADTSPVVKVVPEVQIDSVVCKCSSDTIMVHSKVRLFNNDISSALVELYDEHYNLLEAKQYSDIKYFNRLNPGLYYVLVKIESRKNGIHTIHQKEGIAFKHRNDVDEKMIIVTDEVVATTSLSFVKGGKLEAHLNFNTGFMNTDIRTIVKLINEHGKTVEHVDLTDTLNFVDFPTPSIEGLYHVAIHYTWVDPHGDLHQADAISNDVDVVSKPIVNKPSVTGTKISDTVYTLHIDSNFEVHRHVSYMGKYIIERLDGSHVAKSTFKLTKDIDVPANMQYSIYYKVTYKVNGAEFTEVSPRVNITVVNEPTVELHAVNYDRDKQTIDLGVIASYTRYNNVIEANVDITDSHGVLAYRARIDDGVTNVHLDVKLKPELYTVKAYIVYDNGQKEIHSTGAPILVSTEPKVFSVIGRRHGQSVVYTIDYTLGEFNNHGVGTVTLQEVKPDGSLVPTTITAPLSKNVVINVPYGVYYAKITIPYTDYKGDHVYEYVQDPTVHGGVVHVEAPIVINELNANALGKEIWVHGDYTNPSNCPILNEEYVIIDQNGKMEKFVYNSITTLRPAESGLYTLKMDIKYLRNKVQALAVATYPHKIEVIIPPIMKNPIAKLKNGILTVDVDCHIDPYITVKSHTLTLRHLETNLPVGKPQDVSANPTWSYFPKGKYIVEEKLVYVGVAGALTEIIKKSQVFDSVHSTVILDNTFIIQPDTGDIDVDFNVIHGTNTGVANMERFYVELYDSKNVLVRTFPVKGTKDTIPWIKDLDGDYQFGIKVEYIDETGGRHEIRTEASKRVTLHLYLIPIPTISSLRINDVFSLELVSDLHATAAQRAYMDNIKGNIVLPFGEVILASETYKPTIQFSYTSGKMVYVTISFDITCYGGHIPDSVKSDKIQMLKPPKLTGDVVFVDPITNKVVAAFDVHTTSQIALSTSNPRLVIHKRSDDSVVGQPIIPTLVVNGDVIEINAEFDKPVFGNYYLELKIDVDDGTGRAIHFKVNGKSSFTIYEEPVLTINSIVVNDRGEVEVHSSIDYKGYTLARPDYMTVLLIHKDDSTKPPTTLPMQTEVYDSKGNFFTPPILGGKYFAILQFKDTMYGEYAKNISRKNGVLSIEITGTTKIYGVHTVKSSDVDVVKIPIIHGLRVDERNGIITVHELNIDYGDIAKADTHTVLRLIDATTGAILHTYPYKGGDTFLIPDTKGVYQAEAVLTCTPYTGKPAIDIVKTDPQFISVKHEAIMPKATIDSVENRDHELDVKYTVKDPYNFASSMVIELLDTNHKPLSPPISVSALGSTEHVFTNVPYATYSLHIAITHPYGVYDLYQDNVVVRARVAPVVKWQDITNDDMVITVPDIQIDDPDLTFLSGKATLFEGTTATNKTHPLTMNNNGLNPSFTFLADHEHKDYHVELLLVNTSLVDPNEKVKSNVLVDVHIKKPPVFNAPQNVTNDDMTIHVPAFDITDVDKTFISAVAKLYTVDAHGHETLVPNVEHALNVNHNSRFDLVAPTQHKDYIVKIHVESSSRLKAVVEENCNTLHDVHVKVPPSFAKPAITNDELIIHVEPITINDPDGTFTSAKAVLMKGTIPNGSATNQTKTLNKNVNAGFDLVAPIDRADYYLKVTVLDTSAMASKVEDVSNQLTNVHTKVPPVYTAPTITNDDMEIKIPAFDITDVDNTFTSGVATLYKGTSEVHGQSHKVVAGHNAEFTFTAPDEHADYVVKFHVTCSSTIASTVDHDSNVLHDVHIKVQPTFTAPQNITNDDLTIKIPAFTITDVDGTFTSGVATLYKGIIPHGTAISTQTHALVAGNNPAFTLTAPDNKADYYVKMVVTDSSALGTTVEHVTNQLSDVHIKVRPSFTIPTITNDELTIKVPAFTVTDPDGTFTSAEAILMKGRVGHGTPTTVKRVIVAGNNPAFTLTAPEDRKDYYVKVDVHTSSANGNLVTHDSNQLDNVHLKVQPSFILPDISAHDMEIVLPKFSIGDVDGTFIKADAILYKGSATTGITQHLRVGDNGPLTFTAPDEHADYHVVIHVECSSVLGKVFDTPTNTLHDVHIKVQPTFNVPTITNTELAIHVPKITITDVDGTFSSAKAELFKGSTLVSNSAHSLSIGDNAPFSMTAPSNGDYHVKITVTCSSALGTTVTHDTNTLSNVHINVKPDFTPPTITNDELTINVPSFTITDPDGTYTGAVATLYQGSTKVGGSEHTIVRDATTGHTTAFTYTAPNNKTDYHVHIEVTCSSQLGNTVSHDTNTLSNVHIKVVPTFTPPTITNDELVITVPQFTITDVDGTMTGGTATLYKGTTATSVTHTIPRGTVSREFTLTAPSNGNYLVQITIHSSKGDVTHYTNAIGNVHSKVLATFKTTPTASIVDRLFTVSAFEVNDPDSVFTHTKAQLHIDDGNGNYTPTGIYSTDMTTGNNVHQGSFTLQATKNGNYKIFIDVESSITVGGTNYVHTILGPFNNVHERVVPTISVPTTATADELVISVPGFLITDPDNTMTGGTAELYKKDSSGNYIATGITTSIASGTNVPGLTLTATSNGDYKVVVTIHSIKGDVTGETNVLQNVHSFNKPTFTPPTISSLDLDITVPAFTINDPDNLFTTGTATLWKDGSATSVSYDFNTLTVPETVLTAPSNGRYKVVIVVHSLRGDTTGITNELSNVHERVVPTFTTPTIINDELIIHVPAFIITDTDGTMTGGVATLMKGNSVVESHTITKPTGNSPYTIPTFTLTARNTGDYHVKFVISSIKGDVTQYSNTLAGIHNNALARLKARPSVTVEELSFVIGSFEITDDDGVLKGIRCHVFKEDASGNFVSTGIKHDFDTTDKNQTGWIISVTDAGNYKINLDVISNISVGGHDYTSTVLGPFNDVHAKVPPSFTAPTISNDELKVHVPSFEVIDNDNTFRKMVITLYKDGTATTITKEITSLPGTSSPHTIAPFYLLATSNGDYKVEIVISSTKGDVSHFTNTLSNVHASVKPTLTAPTITNDELTIHVPAFTITDPDHTMTGGVAKLFKGNLATGDQFIITMPTGDSPYTIPTFTLPAPSNGDYHVVITIHSTKGNTEVTSNTLTGVRAKLVPTFTPPTITKSGMVINVPSFTVTDPDSTMTGGTAELFSGHTPTGITHTITKGTTVPAFTLTAKTAGNYLVKILINSTKGDVAHYTNVLPNVHAPVLASFASHPSVTINGLDLTVNAFNILDNDNVLEGIQSKLLIKQPDGSFSSTGIYHNFDTTAKQQSGWTISATEPLPHSYKLEIDLISSITINNVNYTRITLGPFDDVHQKTKPVIHPPTITNVDRTITVPTFTVTDPDRTLVTGTYALYKGAQQIGANNVIHPTSAVLTVPGLTVTVASPGDYHLKILLDTKLGPVVGVSNTLTGVRDRVMPNLQTPTITNTQLTINVPSFTITDTDGTFVSATAILYRFYKSSGGTWAPTTVTHDISVGSGSSPYTIPSFTLTAPSDGNYKVRFNVHSSIGDATTYSNSLRNVKAYITPSLTPPTITIIKGSIIQMPGFTISDPDNRVDRIDIIITDDGSAVGTAYSAYNGTKTVSSHDFTIPNPRMMDMYSLRIVVYSQQQHVEFNTNSVLLLPPSLPDFLNDPTIHIDKLSITVTSFDIDDDDKLLEGVEYNLFLQGATGAYDRLIATHKVVTTDLDQPGYTLVSTDINGGLCKVEVKLLSSVSVNNVDYTSLLLGPYRLTAPEKPQVYAFRLTIYEGVITIPAFSVVDSDKTATTGSYAMYKGSQRVGPSHSIDFASTPGVIISVPSSTFTPTSDGDYYVKVLVHSTVGDVEMNTAPITIHTAVPASIASCTITANGLIINVQGMTVTDPENVYRSTELELYYLINNVEVNSGIHRSYTTSTIPPLSLSATRPEDVFIKLTVTSAGGATTVVKSNTVRASIQASFTPPTIYNHGEIITVPSFGVHDPASTVSAGTATLYKNGSATNVSSPVTQDYKFEGDWFTNQFNLTAPSAGDYKVKIVMPNSAGNDLEHFTNTLTNVHRLTVPDVIGSITISNTGLNIEVHSFSINDPDEILTDVVLRLYKDRYTLINERTVPKPTTGSPPWSIPAYTVTVPGDGSYAINAIITYTAGGHNALSNTVVISTFTPVTVTGFTASVSDNIVSVPAFTINDPSNIIDSSSHPTLQLFMVGTPPIPMSGKIPLTSNSVPPSAYLASDTGTYHVDISIPTTTSSTPTTFSTNTVSVASDLFTVPTITTGVNSVIIPTYTFDAYDRVDEVTYTLFKDTVDTGITHTISTPVQSMPEFEQPVTESGAYAFKITYSTSAGVDFRFTNSVQLTYVAKSADVFAPILASDPVIRVGGSRIIVYPLEVIDPDKQLKSIRYSLLANTGSSFTNLGYTIDISPDDADKPVSFRLYMTKSYMVRVTLYYKTAIHNIRFKSYVSETVHGDGTPGVNLDQRDSSNLPHLSDTPNLVPVSGYELKSSSVRIDEVGGSAKVKATLFRGTEPCGTVGTHTNEYEFSSISRVPELSWYISVAGVYSVQYIINPDSLYPEIEYSTLLPMRSFAEIISEDETIPYGIKFIPPKITVVNGVYINVRLDYVLDDNDHISSGHYALFKNAQQVGPIIELPVRTSADGKTDLIATIDIKNIHVTSGDGVYYLEFTLLYDGGSIVKHTNTVYISSKDSVTSGDPANPREAVITHFEAQPATRNGKIYAIIGKAKWYDPDSTVNRAVLHVDGSIDVRTSTEHVLKEYVIDKPINNDFSGTIFELPADIPAGTTKEIISLDHFVLRLYSSVGYGTVAAGASYWKPERTVVVDISDPSSDEIDDSNIVDAEIVDEE